MADSAQVRTARSRAHKAGDHRHCLASRCQLAGTIALDDVAGVAPLLAILRREFADHPVELAVAERWAQQLAGTGPGPVAAGREIVELRARLRAGLLPPYTGPITIDDEIRALVADLARCECPCHAAGHDREAGR
jgi:hypothetical protein